MTLAIYLPLFLSSREVLMKRPAATWGRTSLLAALPLLLTVGFTTHTPGHAAPSQKPLLSSQSGAKPNVMIAVDNSGSMAFTFHESYGVVADTNNAIELRRCPNDHWSDLTGTWIPGGMADFANGNRCIFQSGGNFYYATDRSFAYFPQRFVRGSWSAQRSANVNPVYYDPRVTYQPRIDANGNPLPSNNVIWVSNQNSASFRYTVNQNSTGQIRTTHTMYASNPDVTGYTNVYTLSYGLRIPQHITYTTTSSTTPGFTYSYCTNVTSNDGLQMGCALGAWTDVTIRHNTSGTINLPTGHNRTDCAGGITATTCDAEKERANILNWFRYYSYRQIAASTAIGQAINGDAYQRKMRLGYMPINNAGSAISTTPGTVNQPTVLRGVRELIKGSTANQQIYDWLYALIPWGGTPLHNSIEKVANYYKVGTDSIENPWSTNPGALASTSNPEKSCRRSFNLLFSDGAWNVNTSTISGQDFDNTNGPGFTGTDASGKTVTFSYSPTGINTPEGRKQYTPYPSAATSGLADLTAKYFWHEDFRTSLANDVQSRPGQPTFWQNMATYTVGYLIKPTGEIPGATTGLTFGQIDTFKGQYAASGYSAATKPQWPTGDLNTGSTQSQIDDFIQAGYTGGGSGFSVANSSQVLSAFDTILSDILNNSGRDAGVAVGAGNSSSSLSGRLKYNVEYQTFDNSGDVVAEVLEADGKAAKVEWRASTKIPPHADRKIFTRSDDSGSTATLEFKGKVADLPEKIQAVLRYGTEASRIATGNSKFVDYLRGADPVTDATGKLYRQRSSKMGAMVNPPSVYMGGSRDYAYDLDGTVDGASAYEAFVKDKKSAPATLFVATNAGMVHSLDAQKGDELAAFMPRRSLKRMLPLANENYNFQYVLDGPLSEHDVYDKDNKRWNHIAVGTGGRGERLIYAIRSPLNKSGSILNRTPEKTDFLWEVGPTSGPTKVGSTTETNTINSTDFTLGYITNPSRSGQTENGEWITAVNSGHYNDVAGGKNHGLLLLNPLTGATVARIPLPASADAGRGLGGVTLVINKDRRIVAALAGDAKGNLWRFDLRGKPENWKVSYGKPLFTTVGQRPIYGAPAWQAHPKKGLIVVVATGILLEEDDANKPSNQEAIYGIWDPTPVGENDVTGFQTILDTELLEQSIDVKSTSVTNSEADRTYYKTTKNKIDWKEGSKGKHRGWKFPLGRTTAELGERSIDQVRNVSTSVFINTLVISKYVDIENESCSVTQRPKNFIYGLRALDGASQRSFDTNGDGKMDDVSVVEVSKGGFDRGLAFSDLFNTPPSSVDTRRRYAPDEESGMSSPEPQKCRSRNTAISGVSGSIGGGLLCDAVGWSRTQYQLSAPPAK